MVCVCVWVCVCVCVCVSVWVCLFLCVCVRCVGGGPGAPSPPVSMTLYSKAKKYFSDSAVIEVSLKLVILRSWWNVSINEY